MNQFSEYLMYSYVKQGIICILQDCSGDEYTLKFYSNAVPVNFHYFLKLIPFLNFFIFYKGHFLREQSLSYLETGKEAALYG